MSLLLLDLTLSLYGVHSWTGRRVLQNVHLPPGQRKTNEGDTIMSKYSAGTWILIGAIGLALFEVLLVAVIIFCTMALLTTSTKADGSFYYFLSYDVVCILSGSFNVFYFSTLARAFRIF